jgi:competence protein ComEC
VRTSLEPIRRRDKGQPAAALASLVIGEYSGLDNSTRAAFQNSGTLHVLVVSGLHVAWLAGLLFQLFRLLRFPERIRFLLAALAMVFYTWVVGFQASITRCLWMFILYLVGRTITRRCDPLNVLLVSALILLAARPEWLFEAGFQLSFLSVMAIATTAVPALDSCLKPLLKPLQHCADRDRHFLEQGEWHRRGRTLRVRCEILIEELADSMHPRASKALRLFCRSLAGTALAVAGMIAVSLFIQLWIEPVLAYNYNRISWISPAANLVMVPFSSMVLAAGIAASMGAHLPLCGPALVRLAGDLASLFLRCTYWIAGFEAGWRRCPTPSAAWVWGGVLLLFAWRFSQWRRFWVPCACIVALLALLSVGSVPWAGAPMEKTRTALHWGHGVLRPGKAPILSLTFLDVGEGDAILMRLPDGKAWLLDAGGLLQSGSSEEGDRAFDIGEAVVSRYLWSIWINRLDRLILSHMDLDHAGGAPAILRNFRVGSLHYPPSASGALADSIRKAAGEEKVREDLLYAGIEEKIGPVMVRVMHPLHRSVAAASNDNSLVMHLSFGRFSALLTGDLEKKGEIDLLSRPVELESLLLKVAHHGSRSATSAALLERVRPRWAVVSAGRNNPHGHPSQEVLRRLLRRGVRFFQTSDNGAVTFETDGRQYAIRSYVRGVLEEGEI